MSNLKINLKTSKAVLILLILVFSLSPCSVKRDLFDIFDIQYISSLNKVRTTSGQNLTCDNSTETSSGRTLASKADFKFKKNEFPFEPDLMFLVLKENQKIKNNYSGYATGNSPPKYILFKRLKLDLIQI
ncbi:hypothetical protein [Chryseobacterium populi]|nr:hypothetical protein [Chryseobacterium populi]